MQVKDFPVEGVHVVTKRERPTVIMYTTKEEYFIFFFYKVLNIFSPLLSILIFIIDSIEMQMV